MIKTWSADSCILMQTESEQNTKPKYKTEMAVDKPKLNVHNKKVWDNINIQNNYGPYMKDSTSKNEGNC